MAKPSERLLDNWVEGFLEYTSVIISPEIFRRWAAYCAIAGALERRAWTAIAGKLLYPNTIVLLVGPPGVGKSNAIEEVYTLWAKAGMFNVAPDGITKAAFIDQLMEKVRIFTYNRREYMCHPLLIATTEFGNLLPEYDRNFLNVLNKVYDCEEVPFADRTRGGGLISVDRAHLTLIAGTQPAYLGDILPEAAYGMGFPARTIMVYAGEKPKKKLFGKGTERNEKLFYALQTDIKKIGKLVGPFDWEDEAKELIEKWNEQEDKDAPTHPKLLNYNPRRIIHTCKIAMSVSIARNNEMLVTTKDFLKAKALLLEAEALMPEIFKEMKVSQDASEIDEIHRFMFSYCRNNEVESVPEQVLFHYMSRKIPVNKIDFFLKTIQSSGLVKCEGLNMPGQRLYRPLPKTMMTK